MGAEGQRAGRRPRRSEGGQVLVLTALALVGLLGFTALVVDVGLLYLGRARCLNAAEAATTAGVQFLPFDPARARAAALQYVRDNGFAPEQAVVSITESNTRIDVTVQQDTALFFARVLGFNTAPVGGTAAARVAALTSLRGSVPLGVEKQSFVYGATYYLKNSPGYGGSYKGNFGCLALGGRGAQNYEENLLQGYDGELQIGDVVETEPGNMSGPTSRGINERIRQDPTGTYEHHDPASPRIIKVPVVEWSGGSGRSTARVVGFAAFWLEGVGGEGNENYVTGRFMQLLTREGTAGSGDDSSYDYGLYTYWLIK
ncbi:MAG: pilus assembly protein TadG-related protein [Bacillota bacterium]|nr:pilus assembly protein TadG-related protein [Bacillota bacterium]